MITNLEDFRSYIESLQDKADEEAFENRQSRNKYSAGESAAYQKVLDALTRLEDNMELLLTDV